MAVVLEGASLVPFAPPGSWLSPDGVLFSWCCPFPAQVGPWHQCRRRRRGRRGWGKSAKDSPSRKSASGSTGCTQLSDSLDTEFTEEETNAELCISKEAHKAEMELEEEKRSRMIEALKLECSKAEKEAFSLRDRCRVLAAHKDTPLLECCKSKRSLRSSEAQLTMLQAELARMAAKSEDLSKDNAVLVGKLQEQEQAVRDQRDRHLESQAQLQEAYQKMERSKEDAEERARRADDAALLIKQASARALADREELVARAEKAKEVLERVFCCTLSLDIVRKPVLAPDGQVYEKGHILRWLRDNASSPLTRKPMRPEQLLHDRVVEQATEALWLLKGEDPPEIDDEVTLSDFVEDKAQGDPSPPSTPPEADPQQRRRAHQQMLISRYTNLSFNR